MWYILSTILYNIWLCLSRIDQVTRLAKFKSNIINHRHRSSTTKIWVISFVKVFLYLSIDLFAKLSPNPQSQFGVWGVKFLISNFDIDFYLQIQTKFLNFKSLCLIPSWIVQLWISTSSFGFNFQISLFFSTLTSNLSSKL